MVMRVFLLVTIWTRHVEDELPRLVVYGLGFEDDGAVGVEELVGDVGEDGGASGEMRPLVTRVRRRARNWRISVPAENSESSGRRSAERSVKSLWSCWRAAPKAALTVKW